MTIPDGEELGATDRDFVQSLERGLAVIRAFDAERPSMSLSEVARRTGLTRATARRFLYTLQVLGYLRSDGHEFALTPKVMELGLAYLSSLGVADVALPHLRALSEELHESCSMAVLDGTDITYVARAAARRIMSVSITVGTRFPAFATAMGRVLLADLPEGERDRHVGTLRPVTSYTVTSRRELDAILSEVSTRGYALVDQELETGLRSIAVPVTSAGRAIASINVSTQSGQESIVATERRCLPALRRASEAISADVAPLRRGSVEG